MIEVENLTKVYGDTAAVRGISFSIPEGEILGFLGPNGAGKTTTMRILTCYTPATSGRAVVGGYDVAKRPMEVRKILGYLPENAPCYGEMTVAGFVDFFAEAKGIAKRSRKAAVERALEECGLQGVGHRLLMNLSKGYRQRAALAQAIVGDPKVLILDEPTVGLDPRQIREVRSLIRGMAGRRTVILSTHILHEVSLTCSRVVIINQGKVVASGSPDHLQTMGESRNGISVTVRGAREAIVELLSRVPHVRKVAVDAEVGAAVSVGEYSGDGQGVHTYHLAVSQGCDVRAETSRALIEKGFDVMEMRSLAWSLEDAFLHALGGEEEGNGHGN